MPGLSPLSIPNPKMPSTSGLRAITPDGHLKYGSTPSVASSGSISSGCTTPSKGFCFGNNGKSNLGFPQIPNKLPMSGNSSPVTRMRPGRQSFSGGPTIQSDINFDKSDVKKTMDIFGPRKVSSAGTSPCDFTGISSPLNGDRPPSASSGRYGKLQKQISTSSEEYNFEGSKVQTSTSRGEGSNGNFKMSDPEVNTWETATGGAKVNRTNEKFEYETPHPGMQQAFANGPMPTNVSMPIPQKYHGPTENDIETALSSLKDPQYSDVKNKGFACALSKILEEMETKKQTENSIEQPKIEEAGEDAIRTKLPSTLKCRLLNKQVNSQVNEEAKLHTQKSTKAISSNHSNKSIKQRTIEDFTLPQPKRLTSAFTQTESVAPNSDETDKQQTIKSVKKISRSTATLPAKTRTVSLQTRPKLFTNATQTPENNVSNAEVQTLETRIYPSNGDNPEDELLERPHRQREILRHYYNKYRDDIHTFSGPSSNSKGATKEGSEKRNGPKSNSKHKYVRQSHQRELLNTDDVENSDSETDGYMKVVSPVQPRENNTTVIHDLSQKSPSPNYAIQRPASASDGYMRVISPPFEDKYVTDTSLKAKCTHATYPISHKEEKQRRFSGSDNKIVKLKSSIYVNDVKERSANALTARQLLTGRVAVPVINVDVRQNDTSQPKTIKVHHVPNGNKTMQVINEGDNKTLQGHQMSPSNGYQRPIMSRGQSFPQSSNHMSFPAGMHVVELGGPNSGIYETDDFTYIIRATRKGDS